MGILYFLEGPNLYDDYERILEGLELCGLSGHRHISDGYTKAHTVTRIEVAKGGWCGCNVEASLRNFFVSD